MAKWLLMEVGTDDEYGDTADIGVAVVEITRDLTASLRKRVQAALALHKKDNALSYLKYMDYTPDWLSYDDARELFGDELDDLSTWIIVEADVTANAVGRKRQRVEACYLSVETTGGHFGWTAYPKHSTVRISSGSPSVEDLK